MPTLTLHHTVVKQKIFSVKLTQKLLKRNHAEVLQQNLYAHQDQDKAARKFCAGAVFAPMMLPAFKPIAESRKVMQPMKLTAGTMFTRRKAKVTPTASASMLVATASGSMVFEIEAVIGFIFFIASGFADHVETDKCQQDEGDPVVDARDQRGKRDAQKIAEKGHQRLKAAEPAADGGACFILPRRTDRPLQTDTAKSVHRQTDSQKE